MSKKVGTIKKFFEDKGYGFIEDGKFDTFFHVNDCPGVDPSSLTPGTQVSFETIKDKRDRVKATNIEVEGAA